MKDILNKIKLFDVIRAVLLVFFLGILLYPTVSDYLGRIHSSQAVSSYNNEVKGIDEATKKQMLEEAQEYNQSLVNTTKLYDPFSTTGKPSKEYMNLLNVSKDGMMAYLQIPKIDVKLPIYHSTSNGILQKGVGHMEGSSLPIGGTSTHAVLSGHRGLPNSKLFTDLDKMKVGDIFYISVLGDTLAYEVDQILPMVDKDDHQTLQNALSITEGQDYVSLFTCTPYGVNSHRLIVRGHRVEYNGEEDVKQSVGDRMLESIKNYYMLILVLGLSITILVIIIMRYVFNKKK